MHRAGHREGVDQEDPPGRLRQDHLPGAHHRLPGGGGRAPVVRPGRGVGRRAAGNGQGAGHAVSNGRPAAHRAHQPRGQVHEAEGGRSARGHEHRGGRGKGRRGDVRAHGHRGGVRQARAHGRFQGQGEGGRRRHRHQVQSGIGRRFQMFEDRQGQRRNFAGDGAWRHREAEGGRHIRAEPAGHGNAVAEGGRRRCHQQC
mmetsp:Transcript_24506/g.55986  ORF Transcript_24506/g.55986 Transcript_24506/m.55986 type:complete len:200 (+) Transcript_24506:1308-1907(+)